MYLLKVKYGLGVKTIWIISQIKLNVTDGILLPKLLWPTVRKNCSIDRENILKFEAEGWELHNFEITT